MSKNNRNKNKQKSVLPAAERSFFNLTVDDDKRLFFVSDTHFGHTKIVSGSPVHFDTVRKYVTVEEMEADIKAQWIATVQPDDTVIFLGDLMFGETNGRGDEMAKEVLDSLPGQKFFVRGNHDQKIKGTLFPVCDYAIVSWRGRKYLCQHLPFTSPREFDRPDAAVLMYMRQDMDPSTTVLVHGHTHSTEMYSKTSLKDFTLQNNVSWDAMYAPVPAEKCYPGNYVYHGTCLGHPVVAQE